MVAKNYECLFLRDTGNRGGPGGAFLDVPRTRSQRALRARRRTGARGACRCWRMRCARSGASTCRRRRSCRAASRIFRRARSCIFPSATRQRRSWPAARRRGCGQVRPCMASAAARRRTRRGLWTLRGRPVQAPRARAQADCGDLQPFELWTLRESWFKLTGAGDLRTIVRRTAGVFVPPEAGALCRVYDAIPGCAAAACSLAERPPERLRFVPPRDCAEMCARLLYNQTAEFAGVMELVDVLDSKSSAARRAGSSPAIAPASEKVAPFKSGSSKRVADFRLRSLAPPFQLRRCAGLAVYRFRFCALCGFSGL